MSHNNFQAFFSAGDDRDEVAGKLFGVIGMLHTENPTSVWRAGFNRQTKSLQLEDIFDKNILKLKPTSDYTINYEVALSKITEKPVNIFKGVSTSVAKSITEEYLDRWVTDSLDDSFYSGVFKNTIRSPYSSINFTSALVKNTIFESKDGMEELKFFLYDFNTLFQKNKVVKDSEIYNLFSSMSDLVFNNIGCDSEIYQQILEEISISYNNHN